MNLEEAIQISVSAHKDVSDKSGQPYIFHPLRVIAAVNTQDEKIVAVLHDVVEDCPEWSFERLAGEGFADHIITALRSVTKVHEEKDYELFVRRAGENPIGRIVKIADLRDNLDVTRFRERADRE